MGTPSAARSWAYSPPSPATRRVRWAWSAYPPDGGDRCQRAPPGPGRVGEQRPAGGEAGDALVLLRRHPALGTDHGGQVPPAVTHLVGHLLDSVTPGQPGQCPPDLRARLGRSVPRERMHQLPLDHPQPGRPRRRLREPLGKPAQGGTHVVELHDLARDLRGRHAEQRPGTRRRQLQLDAGLVAVVVDLRSLRVQAGHGRPALGAGRRVTRPADLERLPHRQHERDPGRRQATVHARPAQVDVVGHQGPDERRQHARQLPVLHGSHRTAPRRQP